MAQQNVNIVVTAEDRASNVFGKIGRALQGLDDGAGFSLGTSRSRYSKTY